MYCTCRVLSDAAGKGYKKAVIEDKSNEHSQDTEYRHGSWRDLEGRGDVAVHGASLLDGEAVLV